MNPEKEYLVPDYFPQFRCKAGSCRSACCDGWPITVSMQEYFRLLGVDCSAELRRKLDCSMYLCSHPSPEAYAQILPHYDGRCPMHREDGLCALQAELGENFLSTVCRLYPRGIRTNEHPECSCANSCEAVLELLFTRSEPISFLKIPLSIVPPASAPRTNHFETAGRSQEIRLFLIRRIQDRSIPLPLRIYSLNSILQSLEDAMNARDEAALETLLNGKSGETPISELPDDEAGLAVALQTIEEMMKNIDERSNSVREYGEAALAVFDGGDGVLKNYPAIRMRFEQRFPDWEIRFEHMLVNHMFFEQFPFQDRPEGLHDEFLAICAVYAVLRFLIIGWTSQTDSSDAFVDVAAAAFRLIDHTSFDRYSSHLLKTMNFSRSEQLSRLLML